jgi:hypothetical protein
MECSIQSHSAAGCRVIRCSLVIVIPVFRIGLLTVALLLAFVPVEGSSDLL